MKFSCTIACFLTSFSFAAAAPNCTIFNWNRKPAYLVSRRPIRISAAKTCHESVACPIAVVDEPYPLSWDYNVSRTLPDTFWQTEDGEGASFYFNLINASLPTSNESSTGVPFVSYLLGTIDALQDLAAGASGYIQMVPSYQCYEGTLMNCTGDVDAPVGIQACAPTYFQTGTSQDPVVINAEYPIHNISAANVRNYSNPFAGESNSGVGGLRVNPIWLALLTGTILAKTLLL